ncbi:MAG: glucose-6-phosphate 1-dehydrogenase [Bryobacterales bacterium]|nr:glucose-6-phosphate 1-dehydrogenase [Bryobacterales bacterium]
MSPDNPFQDPLRFERKMPECAVVIFGANGDLTKRKLMPALYRLALERRLAPGFAVLGISRTPMSNDQFRDKMRESVQRYQENSEFDATVWDSFAKSIFYMGGDVGDPACYTTLATCLAAIERERQTGGNVLFYLSTQPSQYAETALGIGSAGLAKGAGWRRLVVEKPFGHDLESAKKLSDDLHQVFHESEVYRIDHYLGKETVQNILAFRFGNGIFEPLWNRRYVNHVQITAAESIGVEGRGAYYQEAGALRDMIQNHLLQVMATIAMEPSATFQPGSVRDERAKLLRSIRVMKPAEVLCNSVSGQYGPARIGGQDLPGFREEKGVDPGSQTDTYAAATFFVENWRWAGVPFYVRSGKHLPKRVSEIAIEFNAAPHTVFDTDGSGASINILILRIQPEEGISLKFLSKRPGAGMMLRPVSMDFNYGSSFGERSPSAYETLLLDAIVGDATLYTRQDMVEASWAAVEPIQQVWAEHKFEFPNYPAGTWGPAASEEMLARRGHSWRKP